MCFRKKHKDRYDYSEFEYKNSKTKSVIICPTHGRFLQTAEKHIRGQGCSFCGISRRASDNTHTLKNVIAGFVLKHGYLYDYSKFIYVNSKTEGVIICREHGEFLQCANVHQQGHGCMECARIIQKVRSPNIEKVIADFNEKHDGFYDYSRFLYVNSYTKGIVICRIHGEFLISANNHKNGVGCPSCKRSKGEIEIAKILDSMSVKYEGQKTFDDCRGLCRLLPFDFYVPDYNLLIEFDGIQHFKILDWFGGVESFEKLKRNDDIKNAYCVGNNIKLLRIPYTDFESIPFILSLNISSEK